MFYFERLKSNQSLLKLGNQKIKKNNVLIVELNRKGILKNKYLLNLNQMKDIKYFNKITTKEFENKSNMMSGFFSTLREKINAPMRNR